MVLLPNNEDFSASSGVINMPFLDAIYHSIIDETFLALGRTVTLHLDPQIQQDVTTQSQAAPQQYNPFFGRVTVPRTNTRNPGVKIVTREKNYRAHIRVGPMKEGDDNTGIGNLLANEAAITLDIGALPDVLRALEVTIEGRKYSIDETRPFGFSSRRYILCKLTEIQKTTPPSPDSSIG